MLLRELADAASPLLDVAAKCTGELTLFRFNDIPNTAIIFARKRCFRKHFAADKRHYF